jgi:hypothetical protein
MKNYTLNRLLALTATAGFLFLSVDAVLEHWKIFGKEPMAAIPVVFGIVAVLFGIITVLVWSDVWIRRLHLVLLAAFVVAGLGIYFHVEDDDDNAKPATEAVQAEKDQEKPLLAPLAFGAVAVVGLLGTSRKWPGEVAGPSA